MFLHLKAFTIGRGNDLSLDQLLDGTAFPFLIDLPGFKEPIQFLPQLVKNLGPLFLIRLRNRSQTFKTFSKIHRQLNKIQGVKDSRASEIMS